MHGTIKLSLLMLSSIYNSPYPTTDSAVFIPSLKWELQPADMVFVGGTSASRCNPVSWTLWNPQTALWSIEVGGRLGGFEYAIGHVSEHGVDKVMPQTESADYQRLSYTVSF